eukprot:CAMPEP_0177275088 /NCGR_PEP_ID=MMETSP0367-20130122/67525_1 /TAXON_ID=447022 ORGANISM="Scrippsiella hangoei-like, Strain SHHI-4" /NCGR_SAMPLE_ID=MMETSP0367 /ASSEMBLY_ACC=CAM_ASM_000362 /LENGTH=52 /DNA_ID=CAMNT_0018731489 /DNA_START=96 /DNA_END=251 /DNA_ORIENTATION=-
MRRRAPDEAARTRCGLRTRAVQACCGDSVPPSLYKGDIRFPQHECDSPLLQQ